MSDCKIHLWDSGSFFMKSVVRLSFFIFFSLYIIEKSNDEK